MSGGRTLSLLHYEIMRDRELKAERLRMYTAFLEIFLEGTQFYLCYLIFWMYLIT